MQGHITGHKDEAGLPIGVGDLHLGEGVCLKGGGDLPTGMSVLRGRGSASSLGGGCISRPPPDTMRYSQQAGSTHPAGMLSFNNLFLCCYVLKKSPPSSLSWADPIPEGGGYPPLYILTPPICDTRLPLYIPTPWDTHHPC